MSFCFVPNRQYDADWMYLLKLLHIWFVSFLHLLSACADLLRCLLFCCLRGLLRRLQTL